MSLERRHTLLERAQEDDFVVIEDDYESELSHQGSPQPALKSMDRSGRVVFISSSVAVNGSAGPVLHDEDSPNTLDLARYRYARAKVEAEGVCRKAADDGLPIVVVCPCEVYGPNDTGLVTAQPRQATPRRPAPIAVHDDADVPG